MRQILLGLVAAAALALPASAATPATKLTITTRLEGGSCPTRSADLSPATVRGLPAGTLKALDACGAVATTGARLYSRGSRGTWWAASTSSPRGAQ